MDFSSKSSQILQVEQTISPYNFYSAIQLKPQKTLMADFYFHFLQSDFINQFLAKFLCYLAVFMQFIYRQCRCLNFLNRNHWDLKYSDLECQLLKEENIKYLVFFKDQT